MIKNVLIFSLLSVACLGQSAGLKSPNADAVGGVIVTGAPSVGQTPVATGSNTATWQTPVAGSTNPSTCTANTTYDKCLGLSPYTASGGDYTAAILQVIADLHTVGGGTMWVPCATFPANGALRDPTGANAVINFTAVALSLATADNIRWKGMCAPNPYNAALTSTITYSTNTSGGNFIGGYISSGPYGGFINTNLTIEDLTIKSTATAPVMNTVNATFFPTLSLTNVTTYSAASGVPAGGAGVLYSALSNNVIQLAHNVTVVGFNTGVRLGEHTDTTKLTIADTHCAVIPDAEPGTDPTNATHGNGVHIDELWGQLNDYMLCGGISPTTVQVDIMNAEVATTGCVNDSSNLLTGDVGYMVPYVDGRSPSTLYSCPKTGGANIRLHNLRYPGVALMDGTGAYGVGPTNSPTSAINFYAGSTTPSVTLSSKNPFGGGGSPGSAIFSTDVTNSTIANLGVNTTAEPAIFAVTTTCTSSSCYEVNNVGNYPNWLQMFYFPSTWGTPGFITQANSGVVNVDTGGTAGLVLNADASGANVQIGTQHVERFRIGPTTAPSGGCSPNGLWVFSQDGHATFCSAGTWVVKI